MPDQSTLLFNQFRSQFQQDPSGEGNPLKSLVIPTRGKVIDGTVSAASCSLRQVLHRSERDPSQILPRLAPETIQAYSLLDQPIAADIQEEFASLITKTITRGFYQDILSIGANFCGGGLVTGPKNIDGTNIIANFEMWNWLIARLNAQVSNHHSRETTRLKNIKSGLENLLKQAYEIKALSAADVSDDAIYEAAMRHARRIDALTPGQSEIFYGGYSNEGGVNSEGHAQIYEFVKKEKGIDLIVYTSTGFELASTFIAGHKVRIAPHARCENIPNQDILFNEDGKVRPPIFASLLELNVGAIRDKDREVDDTQILRIFDALPLSRTLVPTLECGAITGQRGGTCAPSVTRVWMRKQAENKGTYKQIISHCSLTMLIACAQTLNPILGEDTPEAADARILLTELAQNVLRSYDKRLEDPKLLLNEEAIRQGLATAYAVLDRVEAGTAAVREEQTLLRDDVHLEFADVQKQRQMRKSIAMPKTTLKGDTELHPIELPSLSIQLDRPQALFQAIEETKKSCDRIYHAGLKDPKPSNIRQAHLLAYNMQLHHLLDQIPLPSCHDLATNKGFKVDQFQDDFWKDFTLPELQKAQLELYRLFTQRYLLEGYYQEDLLTRRMATMLPLQTLFHFLSLKIDKELLSNAPHDKHALLENYQIADLSTAAEIEGLQFFNRQEFERVAQARHYMKAFNRSCGLGPLFASEEKTDVDKTVIREYPANGQFWEALLNRDSNLKEAVKIEGNRIVPDFTQQEIEENRRWWINAIDTSQIGHAMWIGRKTIYLKTQAYHTAFQAWKRGGQQGTEPLRPIRMLDQDPGKEPTLLYKICELVNLAPITKAMLACGSFESDGLMQDDASGLILTDNGYRHLDLWRHMTFMGRQMLFAREGEMKLKQIPLRDFRYNYKTELQGVTDYNEPAYRAWDTNRLVDRQHTHLLYSSHLANRRENVWKKETAEGCALQIAEDFRGINEFAWQNIERVLAEWRLAPHQILRELTNHLDLLDDASLQTVFFALLFRHPILKNGEFELGMGQLIQTDEALFEQAKKFINKGLLHAFRTDKSLSSGRFFMEMGFYLSQYLKDAGQGAKADQLNPLQEVRHWMAKKTGLTDQDRSALHLYCVSLSSVKQHLTEEEKARAYADWVLYHLNPPSEAKWKTPCIERSAALFMQRLTFQLSQDLQRSDFCHQLGAQLFADLKLGTQPGGEAWKIDAQLGLPTISSGEWKINLVTGTVSNADGELQRVTTGFPWENENDFKRLFSGEGGFSYRSVGGKYILFTHPVKGTFRLIPPAISAAAEAGEYLIQKQVAGYEGWFDYCPPKMISDSFPQPLISDHAYWIPEKDQLKNLACKGFITGLNKLQIVYAVRDNGEIVEADSTGLSNPNSRCVDYLQPSFKTPDALKGLSRFDLLENIITRRNQKNRIVQIDFPRYCSLDGLPLTFAESNGRLVLGENREYVLAYEAPSALLGTVNNYLFLESVHHRKHRQGMILVPLQKMMVPKDASISAAGSLNIENTEPFVSCQGHPRNELNGNQRYVTLKVEAGGHIVPHNDEGKLFLAYIYLSQRKEEEAVRLLQSIKSQNSFSPEAFAILDLIEQFPIQVDHPDPRMVKLHALNLKIRHQQQRALEPIQEYFKEESGTVKLAGYLKDLAKVIQGHHHISSGCRFTKKEEIALLSLLATEGRAKQEKLNELLKKSYEIELKQIEARIAVLTDSVGAYTLQHLYLGQRKHKRHVFYVKKFILAEDISPPPAALNPPDHFTYRTKADSITHTGSPDSSYEAALAVYELKKLEHEHQLGKELAWLNDAIASHHASQPIRYPYIKPPASWLNFKQGKLFLDVLQVAQPGREADRREMLFRLKMWKENTKNPDCCLEDLMITILCFPNKFLPHIPKEFYQLSQDANTEYNCKYLVLKRLEEIYRSNAYHSADQWPFAQNEAAQESISHPPPAAEEWPFKKSEVVKRPIPQPSPDYPISPERSLEPKVRQLADFGLDQKHLDIAFDPQEQRWGTLKRWRELLVSDPSRPEVKANKDFHFHFNEDLLDRDQKHLSEAVRHEFERLEADYQEGKRLNQAVQINTLPKDAVQPLMKEVEELLGQIIQKRKIGEAALLAKANQRSADEMNRLAEMARLGGKVEPLLSLQDCREALFSFDARFYQVRNPCLSPLLANEVASLTLKWEDLRSYEAQLRKIMDSLQEIKAIDQLSETMQDSQLATRRYLCKKLEGQLESSYDFDYFPADVQVVLRGFCGGTGNIPYPFQMEIVATLMELEASDPTRFRETVVQLIMGGGKTAIIAVIVLYLTAKRKGRAAFFVVPPSQFKTFSANFSESMMAAFGKSTFSLNLVRADFTPHKLQQIHDMLLEAQENDIPIITDSRTLIGMDLEECSLSRRIRSSIREKQSIEKEMEVIRTKMEANQRKFEQLKASKDKYDERAPLTFVHEILKFSTNLEINEQKQKELEDRINIFGHKAQLLAKILTFTQTRADILGDEVDQHKDALFEVIYIDGEKKVIDPMRNLLLLKIYKGLFSKELTVEIWPENQPSIYELLQLAFNNQANFEESDYRQHIVPVLARYVSTSFKPIYTHLGTYKEAFIRYASGKMPDILQTFADRETPVTQAEIDAFPELIGYSTVSEDIAFLKHIKTLYEGDEQQKEASHLISLTKHALLELIPALIGISGGKDYGLSPDNTGEIIPFHGVNAPSNTTRFGYHYKVAALQYQWGGASKPSTEEILNIADSAVKAANRYVEKGENFSDTAEALEFKELFGVDLEDIESPGQVEKAIAFVSQDINRLLDMQFDLAARFATYVTERLVGDGYSWRGAVPSTGLVASSRWLGATPYQHQSYDLPLAKHYVQSLGTEGRVLHKMLERAPLKQIYDVDFREADRENRMTMTDFLAAIYAMHPRFRKIRMITDAGANFKEFGSNMEVAKAWRNFLAEKQSEEESLPAEKKTVDPRIEGVLFFHNDPGEVQPNTLYVFRKGASIPERIGGTSLAALRAKGLTPENTVVFIDDGHKEGTDIPMLADAIALQTWNKKKLIRTVSQASMRPRQFLEEQDVDNVVSTEVRKKLINGGQELEDFVMTSAKNQGIQLADVTPRGFQKQIWHLTRAPAVSLNRQANLKGQFDEEYALLVDKLENFYLQRFEDNPCQQLGSLQLMVNTKKDLKDRLHKYLSEFTRNVENIAPEMVAQVKQQAELLAQAIDQCPCLPQQSKGTKNLDDLDQQVEMEINTEMEQEPQITIEQDIELELKQHEEMKTAKLASEKEMPIAEFAALVSALKMNPASHPLLIKLQDQLKAYPYSNSHKDARYHEVFQQPIFGTVNFFHTCENRHILPVFHPWQRPAKQILVVRTKEGGVRHLLLSEHEAGDAQRHLKFLYQREPDEYSDVWLIQPDGSAFIKADSEPPLETSALLEINIFNGNMRYINDENNREEAEEWLHTRSHSTPCKIRFLKVRTLRNKEEKSALITSPVIAAALGIHHKKGVVPIHICRKRLEWEMNKDGTYKPKESWQTKLLDNTQLIKNLRPSHIPLLGIDLANISDADTQKALEHLRINEGLKGAALEEKVHALNTKQFRSLREIQGPYLTADQVRWLPSDNIHILSDPHQIYRDEAGNRNYLLNQDQVKGLKAHQASFIPFVNPDFYKDFNEDWQIRAVPAHQLHRINPSMSYMLTESQIKSISSDQMYFLKGGANTAEAASFRALFKNLSPKQIGWLHGNHLEHIPAEHLNIITEKQIAEITEPSLIAKLGAIAARHPDVKPGTWASWISPAMVPHIDRNLLQYLQKDEQIAAVPNSLVPLLLPESQVPRIVASQVKSLEGKGQIQACPASFVPALTASQIQEIKAGQVPYLVGSEQIHAIRDAQLFAYLFAEDVRDKGLHNQMPDISEDQLKWITEDQVKGLSNAQLLKLKNAHPRWEALMLNLTPAQTDSFDSAELIALIPASLIRLRLHPAQVGFLREAKHIQECPDRLLGQLNETQTPHISPKQVSGIEGEKAIQAIPCSQVYIAQMQKRQFKFMTPAQALLLDTPQIQSMDQADEIAKLDPSQIQHLLPSQVHLVEGPAQIQAVPCQQIYISQLEKRHLKDLTDQQAACLTPAQIALMDCRDEISKLAPNQIQHLLPANVHFVEGPAQIQAVPCQQVYISQLEKRHLKDLTDQQAACLTPAQIALMDCRDEISKLAPNQIQHLLPANVHFVEGPAQVQAVPCQQVYISQLEKRHLKDLTKQQAACLTPVQIALMDCRDEISKLAPNQIQHLLPANVRFVEGPAQVQAVPCQQVYISQLEKRHLKDLTKQQAACLTPAQIDLMNRRDEISKLDSRGVKLLKSEQVRFIDKTQVCHLDSHQVPALPKRVDLIVNLEKKHFPYLNLSQAALLTPHQIQQMDSSDEIVHLAPWLWIHLDEKGIAQLDEQNLEDFQRDEALFEKAPAINPDLLSHITEEEVIEYLTDSQIDAFGSEGFNKLNEHPLWKRITPAAIAQLNTDKICYLAADQLKYLEKTETLRTMPSGLLVHLTKAQLVQRKHFSLIYVIGVLTLDVAVCLVYLAAYPIFAINGRLNTPFGVKYKAVLNTHVDRVFHLFHSYIPAAMAA